jgi:hypothetical protein
MGNRYFRRRWDERRGAQFDGWGGATYYFEADDAGQPIRQVEMYDAGPVLHYGPDHEEDECGQLGATKLDELEDWTTWAITREDFEVVWNAQA